MTAQGSHCVNLCKHDELLDLEANCYKCQINQYKQGIECRCKEGYIMNVYTQHCLKYCVHPSVSV